MKQIDAVLYQDRLAREQERLKQEVRAREFAQLERTTTTNQPNKKLSLEDSPVVDLSTMQKDIENDSVSWRKHL